MSHAALSQNLDAVRARIAAAANRAGRDPERITLVAVTKYVDVDTIRALHGLGVTHFGENRVEAAEQKIATLAGEDIVWHMIGNIQRRKTKDVVRLFDKIDALDRIALAEAIQSRCEELDAHAEVLIEVNVSGESRKHGFSPDGLPDALASVADLDRLRVRGLLTMAPYGASADEARSIFRRLAGLAGDHGLPDISMGMSDDFEWAIEAGATEVRVGSALFDPVA